jgi:hypothetical protein
MEADIDVVMVVLLQTEAIMEPGPQLGLLLAQ